MLRKLKFLSQPWDVTRSNIHFWIGKHLFGVFWSIFGLIVAGLVTVGIVSDFMPYSSESFTVVSVNGDMAVLEPSDGDRNVYVSNPFPDLKIGDVVTDLSYESEIGWIIIEVEE